MPLNQLESMFPQPPKHRANWWAVYLDPSVMSNERICAVIVLILDNGAFAVQRVLTESLIKHLWPDNAENKIYSVDLAIHCVTNHLEKNNTLNGCEMPTGMSNTPFFHVTEERKTACDDLDDGLKTIMPLATSFGPGVRVVTYES